jgi:hypothetical protein
MVCILTFSFIERLLSRLVKAAAVLCPLAKTAEHEVCVDLIMLIVSLGRLDGDGAIVKVRCERGNVIALVLELGRVGLARFTQARDAIGVEEANSAALQDIMRED